MDEGETPEQAALRELEEETGYIGKEIIGASSVLASDPGQGVRRHKRRGRFSDNHLSRDDERNDEARLSFRHMQ